MSLKYVTLYLRPLSVTNCHKSWTLQSNMSHLETKMSTRQKYLGGIFTVSLYFSFCISHNDKLKTIFKVFNAFKYVNIYTSSSTNGTRYTDFGL